MIDKKIWILIIVALFFSCNRNINKVKVNNSPAIEQVLEEQFDLVHVVYFELKKAETRDILIKEIKKLQAIEVVHNLEIGTFTDLGDERALSQYDLMMQMDFKNKKEYEIYKSHPLHLELKKVTMSLLAGPPATYDYLKVK